MGQKVHPIGFRLGFHKTWKSQGYSATLYTSHLKEDLKINNYIKSTLPYSSLSKIYRKRGIIYLLLKLNYFNNKEKIKRIYKNIHKFKFNKNIHKFNKISLKKFRPFTNSLKLTLPSPLNFRKKKKFFLNKNIDINTKFKNFYKLKYLDNLYTIIDTFKSFKKEIKKLKKKLIKLKNLKQLHKFKIKLKNLNFIKKIKIKYILHKLKKDKLKLKKGKLKEDFFKFLHFKLKGGFNELNLLLDLIKLKKLKRLKLNLYLLRNNLSNLNTFKIKNNKFLKKLLSLILILENLKLELLNVKSPLKKEIITTSKINFLKNIKIYKNEIKDLYMLSHKKLYKEMRDEGVMIEIKNIMEEIMKKKEKEENEDELNKRLSIIKSNLNLMTHNKIKIIIKKSRSMVNDISHVGNILYQLLSNPTYKKNFKPLYYKLYRTLITKIVKLKKKRGRKKKLQGFRIRYGGKLWSKGRSKPKFRSYGPVSLQNLNQIMDYQLIKCVNRYGVTGFKIWFNYYPRKYYIKKFKNSIIHYKPLLYLLKYKKIIKNMGYLLYYYKNKLNINEKYDNPLFNLLQK